MFFISWNSYSRIIFWITFTLFQNSYSGSGYLNSQKPFPFFLPKISTLKANLQSHTSKTKCFLISFFYLSRVASSLIRQNHSHLVSLPMPPLTSVVLEWALKGMPCLRVSNHGAKECVENRVI